MWSILIDSIYLTILYPITLVICIFIGYKISKKMYINKNRSWKASGIETSVISIFALLLSFTFLSSYNSMKSRVELMHETSDASENLRRTSLLSSDSLKLDTREYLIDYLDILHNFRPYYLQSEEKLKTEIEKVNKVYLAQLVAISRSGAAGKKEVENLIPYFNQLNANFYHIINSYDERTPHIIILLLLVSSWLIGILIGFMNAFHERRHFLVPFIFVVLVSGSIQCIRDLDNPYEGIIQPNFNDFANQREALIQHIR